MSDQYQTFAQSQLGKLVVKNLGLPAPVTLDRYQVGQSVIDGAVLIGAAENNILSKTMIQILKNIQADTYTRTDIELEKVALDTGLNLRTLNVDDKTAKFKALIFDASGIQTVEQLEQLYQFFNPVVRQVIPSGRIIILGISPEHSSNITTALAQRALEGFVKSIAKELKKGITAQLVYVEPTAKLNFESTLRFLLSPRSTYVSGQVFRISQAEQVVIDWQKPLAGRIAVVTGASRGIGEAIARVLARDGAQVICLDVEQQLTDLHRVAQEINGSVLALDITAEDAGEQIKQAAEKLGGLDILVHNAGITRDKMLANMQLAQWQQVLNINLAANQRINDYLLQHNGFNDNARIICVSSISGIAGNLGQTNYATSKAGVIGLVKFTAPALKNGITINAVAPGFIETQMTAAIPFAMREAGRRMNSMSQGGLPIDVAETIALFACAASTGLNGNVIRVCGQSLLGA